NLTIKTPRSALHFSQKPLQKSLSTTPEKNPQSTFKKVLDSEDTIVAISTPPGRGGIGIVRLSGPNARAIAEPLLKLRHPLAPAQARFAQIIDKTGEDQETVLDEAIVTWFQKPHSYTSEDVVEIASHSSPVLLDLLVRQCL